MNFNFEECYLGVGTILPVNDELPVDFQKLLSGDYVDKFDPYHELMKFKVRKIMVVASFYDDFVMEQDQTYTEQLTEEYSRLNLSTPPPRIFRVSNVEKAFVSLHEDNFDLVIITSRAGMDPFDFGRQVKKSFPHIATVLLLTSFADVLSLPPEEQRDGIDSTFIYTGNSDIFLTIVKQVEDRRNAERDTQIGKVRVIIVVEDTIAYYSIFLPLIYTSMVKQTRRLIQKSVNHAHRLLLVRGRPKIMLATNYDEAFKLLHHYQDNVFAVISDIAYPIGGVKKEDAGFQLAAHIKERHPHVAVLLQSSDASNRKRVEDEGYYFVHKHSLKLLKEISEFFEDIGFGDFIFRDKNGKEIARARDVTEFQKTIKTIPQESIIRHAQNHHFSRWLYTRAEFDLAKELRSKTVDDFNDAEDLREYLAEFFRRTRSERKKGIIAEFTQDHFETSTPFARIGNGSLGGKGRGLAFVSTILNRTMPYFNKKYQNIKISVPDTIVISTDWFEKFIEEHDLFDVVLDEEIEEQELKKIILSKNLPKELRKYINEIAKRVKHPIAVRSSSLLEDSQFQPFAGIYTTYLLPNSKKKYKERADDIETAIKLVYASTYTPIAKSYIKTTGQKIEIEKMAVILQKVVGKIHKKNVYPSFSGVAQSYNYYPFEPAKSEDGVVHLAVGLGPSITEGRKYLSYSPKFPKRLVQHYSPEASMSNSQSDFYLLPLSDQYDLRNGEFATLKLVDLRTAEEDGELIWSGATVDFQNNRIVDGIRGNGPRVITFPFILKYNRFPLSEIVHDLLKLGKEAFGCEVEIEFSVNLDYKNGEHEFYILQIRPLVTDTIPFEIDLGVFQTNECLLQSDKALGNGIIDQITDIVYVNPETFKSIDTIAIREEIRQINQILRDENREYLLLGPGRWGTADRFLGIPVRWNDIDYAKVIVEYGLPNFQVDPSYGSHFFLNITSTRKGYFTVPFNSNESIIDWEMLRKIEPTTQTEHVIHVRLQKAITVLIDGKRGKGVILKPNVDVDKGKVEDNKM